ncbi:MAG: hypothetical protein FGM32_11075 [Candidatus Kapabacteria bacterium]|nr:hypothetical protein [Candidatus Kapabacteria bacterium]
MKFFRFIVLSFVAVTAAMAQPAQRRDLRGTIDQCHAVQILDNVLPVDSLRITPPLSPSTSSAVLMCMVGTFPASSDSTDVVVLGDAGRVFEVAVSGAADTITHIDPLELDTNFRTNIYQLIVPITADTIVVDSLLTTSAWNGARGGVIMLHASSILHLRGNVDVSGLGFSGGRRSLDGGACGLVIPCDPAASQRTGQKGQSPLLRNLQCASGHTPWASGGGGGDAHNAGGGGGGNGGSGGRGGNQYPCSDPPGMWGMAGLRLVDAGKGRLFLGSGGGGGHQNNSVATDGGNGGGIVMIRTRQITGDSARIRARGTGVQGQAGNDGAGGGGGGGTVRIEACSTSNPIFIDASGGRGGETVGQHGPGGGGGGGRAYIEPALLQDARNVRFSVDGGASGTIIGQPTNSNGAQPGATGFVEPICEQVIGHSVEIPTDAVVGDTLRITVTARDTTSRCECMISHRVRLVGSAASPLTGGTTMRGRALLTTVHDGNNISYDLLIPSRMSTSIPFLCALSGDSSISTSYDSYVESNRGDTLCILGRQQDSIDVDVCGHSLRRVVLVVPFGIFVRSDASRQITIDLESAHDSATSLRIYTTVGAIMTERNVEWTRTSELSVATLHLDASEWPHGVYFVVAQTAHGTRTAMIWL